MKYNELVNHIELIHQSWYTEANKAINIALTLRNWMIGYYIVEYEQDGEDRASYGTGLLKQLEDQLKPTGIKGMNVRAFRNYRKFYQVYPSIWGLLTAESSMGSLFRIPDSLDLQKRGLPTTESPDAKVLPIDKIISQLSYTHLEQLMQIEDQTKRTFYEIETMKGTWSVSQLKRQINSLYYERSGMSKNPELLNPHAFTSATDIVHDVYSLEFMGLPSKMAVSESDLEKAILDNIEHFLLELGRGFCFEARQKKILIGDEYFFIDLVFYHRILKCHVLIDLKVAGFSHENAGQLNTYVNYYKAEVMDEGDNPPIGILFVTDKNRALVEYATAGMDDRLFVKQYLIELPDKSKMEQLIAKEIQKI